MSSHAAFLRGMNIGGRRITNEQLRELFTALGFSEVATFRASGNVVFRAGGQPERELARRVQEGLAGALGYEVPAYVRSAEEVRGIAAHRPFEAEIVSSSGGKLQVGLLSEAPSARARRAVLALAGEDDLLAFGERELYWLPSGGILDSPLDLPAIARLIGAMTVRTKGTMELLAAKHLAPPAE